MEKNKKIHVHLCSSAQICGKKSVLFCVLPLDTDMQGLRTQINTKINLFNLRVSGTPRGVYISVGEIPTRQLTVRAVVKGTVSSVGGHKS
ncbi:MAG: hypothetical protein JXA79_09445 [Deltaproteobacteria bacterium]|nr:hypothetical protein [Deltaproteobacteria bacterium]